MSIKVWLDDERIPPTDSWIWTNSASKCIQLLKDLDVSIVSLDHDLGDEEKFGNGYDVMKWIEEQVFTTSYTPPRWIKIHTANPVAETRMQSALTAILAELERRKIILD